MVVVVLGLAFLVLAVLGQQQIKEDVLRVRAAEMDPNAWRLIEVNEGERIWMQRKDMLRNMTGQPGKRSHFFDVTDLPLLNPSHPPAPAAPPIPDKPKQQVTILSDI